MRVAGLIHTEQALDLEFVKSMRSISSWVHGVCQPGDTEATTAASPEA